MTAALPVCSNCGSTAFWRRGTTPVCSRCHPPVDAPPVRVWTVPQHPLAGKRVSDEELGQRFTVKR